MNRLLTVFALLSILALATTHSHADDQLPEEPAYISSMRKGLEIEINGPLYPPKFGDKSRGYSSAYYTYPNGKENFPETLFLADGHPSDKDAGCSVCVREAYCAFYSRASSASIFRIPGKKTYSVAGDDDIYFECEPVKGGNEEWHSRCTFRVNLRENDWIECVSPLDKPSLSLKLLKHLLGNQVVLKMNLPQKK